MLMGAVRVKARVQHPKVTQRKDHPIHRGSSDTTLMLFSQMGL